MSDFSYCTAVFVDGQKPIKQCFECLRYLYSKDQSKYSHWQSFMNPPEFVDGKCPNVMKERK